MSERMARLWLPEWRRSGVSSVVALLGGGTLVAVLSALDTRLALVDGWVLVLLVYLSVYLVLTTTTFVTATPAQIHDWARRESRGTVLERYVLGTAPGPGVSIFIVATALAVAVLWLPGHGGGSLPDPVRIAVAVALIVVGWVCVLVSFAVAFHADDIVEDRTALRFPGDAEPEWADYVYFAVSVMTTFGTTDVTVLSREMRRTVSANGVIAFVFNTVTIAATVSALTSF
ncbi:MULTISPECIES: DUF1345 domain-containing protein [Pseudonocardia]|uniref:DUF1345 domain-containing protein n=2 Tax=Pseudonocardia TaxID=1847 RepID=A0A1Y2MXJ8_PSEAH|nr:MULTISPECIES: DUF1345 domain-containing protein [Pseudonocardia]OSY39934.1 hypothetical protein BG845_03169 [Pseudonocardia autotrophica]TDN74530.1 putative membrane protein [Pseudonocardia autotrophica]BBG05298.1 hypothetical protein Pdca_65070 [Pseudonocardia autotrophica]GEC28832.1 hypothetical protein PSA01_58610 [Pseudonocardia saturnea]